MQWHWGNIGSFLGGAATAVSVLIVAAVTLIRGPPPSPTGRHASEPRPTPPTRKPKPSGSTAAEA